MEKDWTGNGKRIYVTLGASSHAEHERQKDDFYATEPKAIDLLLDLKEFNNNIWECACGQGHLSERLKHRGYDVLSTDLINRNYGDGEVNFLECKTMFEGDIITNPPYKYAREFVEKALELIPIGNEVAMFLKLQFLEGKARKELFKKHPPKKIYISSSRLKCAINGEFDKCQSSAVAYAWYIWEKGYKGQTVIEWFN